MKIPPKARKLQDSVQKTESEACISNLQITLHWSERTQFMRFEPFESMYDVEFHFSRANNDNITNTFSRFALFSTSS